MREIPVSIADFEHLIKQDCVYVDKTKYIYDIVSSPNIYYFLSRPRRFGKSLTISTLQAIFEGKKELFKDLNIENTDWKWEKHPIVRLDFNRIEHQNPQELSEHIKKLMLEISKQFQVNIEIEAPNLMFYSLIVALYKEYNQKVVVLIDEYDKPVISHLGLGEDRINIARQNKEFLKVFYDNLKPLEPYLKTVFITGVSKFSKISIFSTLNNLIELDTMADFADFLGYTDQELKDNFHEYFEVMSSKKNMSFEALYDEFKKYYNGFRFTKKEVSVYNPFSVGKALYSKEISNYWFESGTPTFLINLMKEKNYNVSDLSGKTVEFTSLNAFDIERLKVEPLLFQTGYLTIKEMIENNLCKVDFPNYEVEHGFLRQLIIDTTNDIISYPDVYQLKRNILNNDFNGFIELLKSKFSEIPYSIIPSVNSPDGLKNKIASYELYYHSLFYMASSLMWDNKDFLVADLLSNTGRIDMALITNEKVLIFEFKVDQTAETAIQQIKDRGYADRFKSSNKRIILIGIDFSSEKRNIRDYLVEEI